MTRPAVAAFLFALAWSLACGMGYKENMTAERLAESDRPQARIVAYLSQTSADPDVCDTTRQDGLAVAFVDRRVIDAVHNGLDEGTIPPGRFTDCVMRFWKNADAIQGADLSRALSRSLKRAARPREVHGLELARLEALRDLIVERPAGFPIDPETLDALIERTQSSAAAVGPKSRQGIALLEIAAGLEVERGTLEGQPVTNATIERSRNEAQLLAWAERLPVDGLRRAAGQRLVQVRIENSPLSWVRDNADAIAPAALQGRVELPATAAILKTRFAPRSDGTTHLRVLQQARKVRLLPATADNTRTADPSLDLAGSLLVDVDGFERPLTICREDRFDPTPCISPRRLQMTHPVAVLAPTGRIVFPTQIKLVELLKLGQDGDRLDAQVSVDGVVGRVDLPLIYDTLDPLIYGIGLEVDVFELSSDRLLFEIRALGKQKIDQKLVVPMTDRFFSLTVDNDTANRASGASASSSGGKTSASVQFGYDRKGAADLKITMHCTNCKEVREYLKAHTSATGEVVIRNADAKKRPRRKPGSRQKSR